MSKPQTIGEILKEYRQQQATPVVEIPEMLEHYHRKQQVQDIVNVYVNKYTCAVMGDYNLAEETRLCEEANNWLKAQCSANEITQEELDNAIKQVSFEADQNGTACAYDLDLFK